MLEIHKEFKQHYGQNFMRSLGYILGKPPQNFDDCMDKLRKEGEVRRISLKLEKKDGTYGEILADFLDGIFTWNFKHITIVYQERFGAVLAQDDYKRQKTSVDNANKRLERYLDVIGDLELEVEGEDKRFEYPTSQ